MKKNQRAKKRETRPEAINTELVLNRVAYTRHRLTLKMTEKNEEVFLLDFDLRK